LSNGTLASCKSNGGLNDNIVYSVDLGSNYQEERRTKMVSLAEKGEITQKMMEIHRMKYKHVILGRGALIEQEEDSI